MEDKLVYEYAYKLYELTNKSQSEESVRSFSLREGITSLKELKVAAVMDGFTFHCFQYECNLLYLHPDSFEQEILEFEPDFVFIESVWEGLDFTWRGKASKGAVEIEILINFCKSLNIPVVFWNKEDPVHTDIYMDTARLCDFVFTTDADVVNQYKMALGHDRIYHLHFAAQPVTHNPIEKYDRKQRICFAGAYYHAYKERNHAFDEYIELFEEKCGIDIFDRNMLKPQNSNQFPERYKRHIVGTLAPDEIDVAYKGYSFGLNLCSVTSSQTMFARRVFELCASNTVVFSNYAKGIRNYFGDLVICTNNLEYAQKRYSELEKDNNFEKLRLLALRKTLREHLYEDRLDRIVHCVFGTHLKRELPHVIIINGGRSTYEKERVKRMFERQTYEKKLLVNQKEVPLEYDGFIGVFSSDDYYGVNYITDMMLSCRYSNMDGYVKPTGSQKAYTFCDNAVLRSSLLSAKHIDLNRVYAISDIANLTHKGNYLNTDAYNYRKNCITESCSEVDDLIIKNQGFSLLDLERVSFVSKEHNKYVTCKKMQKAVSKEVSQGKMQTACCDNLLYIENITKQVEYFELTPVISIVEYRIIDSVQLELSTECSCAECTGVIWFYIHDDTMPIGQKFFEINKASCVKIPLGVTHMKIGIRMKPLDKIKIKKLSLCKVTSLDNNYLCNLSKTIVLTNQYPKWDDPYKNMFVHKRVCEYKRNGKDVSVVCLDSNKYAGGYEIDGIEVHTCHYSQLDSILSCTETVCVHFLFPEMWEIIKHHLDHIKLIIWMHGFEIQPWERRTIAFENGDYPEDLKQINVERVNCWKQVFEKAKVSNINFVCVSEYLKRTIEADYSDVIDGIISEKIFIIHNGIDTEFFDYQQKKPEDRKRILSIRPYASRIYANDLMVKCIKQLAKEPWFNDLSFTVIGDGKLFEETIAPLKKYKNVSIRKGFLSHSEIRELHRENGIFIVPTRLDTQGVSRDEAMSSGLVPVTNMSTAVPEFCNDKCAILAPENDYKAMAAGIKKLYKNPELFMNMSLAAAKQVRKKTGMEQMISKEIELIFNEK